jgi:hypothetical protein
MSCILVWLGLNGWMNIFHLDAQTITVTQRIYARSSNASSSSLEKRLHFFSFLALFHYSSREGSQKMKFNHGIGGVEFWSQIQEMKKKSAYII